MSALYIYHGVILAILLLVLANVLLNLAAFDGLTPAEPPTDAPLVSVLIPARNEALNIEACVGSLLRQDYPRYELIVLDDHSEDGTGAIIDRLIAASDNPRVTARKLGGEPLPAGWTGKNWACHQLSQAARGEFLFFTDADTAHAPGTITATVDYARRNRASLVSAWPRQLTETLGEKLIVPVILLMGIAFCPLWLQRRIQDRGLPISEKSARGMGVANGQFMFFTRAAYEQIGGHEAVRSHVVEDVTLGREVAVRMSAGMRLFNCDALQFSTVRMYRSFRETWEGFTKNMRAVFDENHASFWLFGALQWSCLFAPCLMLLWQRGPHWPLLAAQVAIIYLVRAVLAARFRTSWLGALLHPLGLLLMMGIALNSWRLSHGSGVLWKGRTIKPKV